MFIRPGCPRNVSIGACGVPPLFSSPAGEDWASSGAIGDAFAGPFAIDEHPQVALMENEDDGSTPQRRCKAVLKFSPKVLPKKASKIIPKTEPQEENEGLTIDNKIMAALGSLQSTHTPGSGTKAEKQGTPVQVAFGHTDPSVSRTFPTPRNSSSGGSAVKLPKEHDEPWDYTCTNYPVTLPLRRPYSGDPDEEEFGDSSGRSQDGELSGAEKLGLWEKVDNPQLLFFQLPTTLPLPRQADRTAETEIDTNVNAKSMGDTRKRRLDSIHGCGLKELPGGFMGKILVYKSGKVKMTLSDALFDVSAGSSCMFAQEVAVINTKEKHCCGLGELGKRVIVTPDINSLLGSMEKM